MSVMTATGQDDAPAVMWGRREYKYAGKHLGTGNRCGHDPQRLAADKLALPDVAGGHRLQVITKLLKRAEGYFADPASVPLLAYLSGKTNRDGSPRQNRSEGREAQSLILSAIIAATDFKSLRVGTYTERGEFRNVPFAEIARRCGMLQPSKDPAVTDPVPSSRFWRGVAWLKRAGAIEVFEQYEETADGKRGRPAIKIISEKFLRALGGLTKAAMKTIRKKASHSVAKYLTGAVQGGVQSIDEQEQLEAEVRSQRTKKALFPVPVIKNQFPKDVTRDNSADSYVGEYDAYVKTVYEQLEQELGRPVKGLEGMKLFNARALSRDEWERRRAKL